METFFVKKEDANNRIDSYLVKQKSDLSRVTVQRLIDEEKILVNDKKTKSSYKVQNGDIIKIEET